LQVHLIGEQGASEGFTLIVIGCGGGFGRYRDCRIDEAKPNPLQEDIALPALGDVRLSVVSLIAAYPSTGDSVPAGRGMCGASVSFYERPLPVHY
jgi:hypothetical protein